MMKQVDIPVVFGGRSGRDLGIALKVLWLGVLAVVILVALAGCTSSAGPELPPLTNDGPKLLTKDQKDRAIQDISDRKT